jgi:hypothetical protein
VITLLLPPARSRHSVPRPGEPADGVAHVYHDLYKIFSEASHITVSNIGKSQRATPDRYARSSKSVHRTRISTQVRIAEQHVPHRPWVAARGSARTPCICRPVQHTTIRTPGTTPTALLRPGLHRRERHTVSLPCCAVAGRHSPWEWSRLTARRSGLRRAAAPARSGHQLGAVSGRGGGTVDLVSAMPAGAELTRVGNFRLTPVSSIRQQHTM